MSKDLFVFYKSGTYCAFNRLTMDVAYGDTKESVMEAVRNESVNLELYDRLADEQCADYRVLYLILTDNCNFNCEYCYERDFGKASKNMTFETAKKVINVLIHDLPSNPKKPYYLNFYGGEPLLNFPVLKASVEYFIESIKKFGGEYYISIVTNGALITDDVAEFFKCNKIDVFVSLDGSNGVNDYQRKAKNGQSAYDCAAKALRTLSKHGLEANISFTITHNNIDGIEKQIEFLEKEFNTKRIILNPLVIQNKDGLKFARQTFGKLVEFREYLWSRNNTELTLPQLVSRFVSHDYGWKHCACQRHQVVAKPDGTVGPCLLQQNNDKYFNKSIDDIVNCKDHADKLFPEFFDRVSVRIPECRDCIALMLCRGGCASNAINIFGDPNKPDLLMCSSAKDVIENIIWDAYKSRPSGKPL